MDISRTFMSLRPDAVFTNNQVNFFSLETIAKTYTGIIPTQSEMDAEWINIQAQDAETARIISIKEEANKRILELDPEWTIDNHDQKQRNDLMAGEGILLNICKALSSGIQVDIDAAIAEGDAAMAKALKIKEIRSMSDIAETNGDSVIKFQTDLDAAGY